MLARPLLEDKSLGHRFSPTVAFEEKLESSMLLVASGASSEFVASAFWYFANRSFWIQMILVRALVSPSLSTMLRSGNEKIACIAASWM
jgi:hypothetical protein